MNWKRSLVVLTAVAGPAFADPPCDDPHVAVSVGFGTQPAQYIPAQPVPPPAPQPAPQARPGRWELRSTQQWQPGATQSVWVEGRCESRGRFGRRTVCSPGRYETVTTPGRYVTVQQWVWVDAPRPHRWARNGPRF